MNRHFASALAFSSTVALATLASAVMTASAIAETPTIDATPYAGSRTRAEVQSEVMRHRGALSAAGSEWRAQGNAQPFAGTRSRADVQAEMLSQPATLTAAASEWNLQANQPQERMSTITRAQATAEYIAARDQVRAMNSEDSGSSYFAQMPRHSGSTLIAGGNAAR